MFFSIISHDNKAAVYSYIVLFAICVLMTSLRMFAFMLIAKYLIGYIHVFEVNLARKFLFPLQNINVVILSHISVSFNYAYYIKYI